MQPPLTEVAPLGLGLRALAERCNHLSQEVAPLELGLRALAGGATAPDRRWHRPEAQSSSSARRCNRSSQEVQPPDPRIPEIDSFELQI